MSNSPTVSVPTVSVLMPVYNAEQYLAQAVDSILTQTFQDFELIVVNDGSTDRSLEILESYTAKDDRIQLISRENWGIPRTRNQMLAHAKGEFVAVMDSDDVAFPDRLAGQVEFLRQNPAVVWVGGAFELIDEKGRLLTRIPLPEQNDEIKRLLADGNISFLHPSGMIRRADLLAVGGYDESLTFSDDLDVWLKLSQVGALANLPQPVVQYRIHRDSICDRHRGTPPPEVQEVLDRAWHKGIFKARQQATTVCSWRPGTDRASRHNFMLKYGWWAFNSKQRNTAVFYGTRAIALSPFSLESWKLLACAAVKPLPSSELP